MPTLAALLVIGTAALPEQPASAGTGDPQVYAKTGELTAHAPGFPAVVEPWQPLVRGEVGVGLYNDAHWTGATIAAPMPGGASQEMWSGAGTWSGVTCVVAESHHQRLFQDPGPGYSGPIFFSMLKQFDDPSPAWDCVAVWLTDPVTPTQPDPTVRDLMVGALTDQSRVSSVQMLTNQERQAIVRSRWTPVIVRVYNGSPFPIGPVEVTGRDRRVEVRGARIASIPPFSVRPARLQMRTDARGKRGVRVQAAAAAGALSVLPVKVLGIARPPRLTPGRYEARRGRIVFEVDRSRNVRDLHGRILSFCGGSGAPSRTSGTFPDTRVPRRGVVGSIRRTTVSVRSLSLRVLERTSVRMELVVTPLGPLRFQECGGSGSFTVTRVGRR